MCFSIVPPLSLETSILLQLQHAPRVVGVGSHKTCLCVNLRFVFALQSGGGVGLFSEVQQPPLLDWAAAAVQEKQLKSAVMKHSGGF